MSAGWQAVVPVKGLAGAKSRLGAPGPDRSDLVLAMLADVLAALTSSAGIEAVHVLSTDARVLARAAAAGARGLTVEREQGLNADLAEAVHRFGVGEEPTNVCIVVADLPGLRALDVDAILQRAPTDRVSFVPDLHGGTTMLLVPSGVRAAPRFGPDSARAHGRIAVRLDDAPRTARLDVDTAADLQQALGTGVGPATREWSRARQRPSATPAPGEYGRAMSLPPAFDAVLFDMDGTLVDSFDSVERCWSQLADAMGMPGYVFPHGMTSEATLRAVLPDASDEVIRHWHDLHVEIEIADSASLQALPGAARLIDALETSGVPWGIATSCSGELAEARLVAAGLPRPEVFVVAGDYVHGKPQPDPFLLAASLLGADPTRCLVVEDAPPGVAAGLAAGAVVCAVTHTHGADELQAAHAIVDSLDQLRELLETDAHPLAPLARKA